MVYVVRDLSWSCSSLLNVTTRSRSACRFGIRRSGKLTVRFAATAEFEQMEAEKGPIVLPARLVFGYLWAEEFGAIVEAPVLQDILTE